MSPYRQWEACKALKEGSNRIRSDFLKKRLQVVWRMDPVRRLEAGKAVLSPSQESPHPELMSARTQRTRGEEALETQLVRR